MLPTASTPRATFTPDPAMPGSESLAALDAFLAIRSAIDDLAATPRPDDFVECFKLFGDLLELPGNHLAEAGPRFAALLDGLANEGRLQPAELQDFLTLAGKLVKNFTDAASPEAANRLAQAFIAIAAPRGLVLPLFQDDIDHFSTRLSPSITRAELRTLDTLDEQSVNKLIDGVCQRFKPRTWTPHLEEILPVLKQLPNASAAAVLAHVAHLTEAPDLGARERIDLLQLAFGRIKDLGSPALRRTLREDFQELAFEIEMQFGVRCPPLRR